MLDQCIHCALRGNMKSCKATKCSHHETWYAQTLRKQQNDFLEELEHARNLLNDNIDKICKKYKLHTDTEK